MSEPLEYELIPGTPASEVSGTPGGIPNPQLTASALEGLDGIQFRDRLEPGWVDASLKEGN